MTTPLAGRHNIYNSMAAAGAMLAVGLDLETIRTGLATVRRVPGRLERVGEQGSGVNVFVDYAHTDDALDNVLRAVRPLTPGRLWCVFGCGGDRDRTKRPRMAAVAARLADAVVVTSDNPRTEDPERILDDVEAGMTGKSHYRIVDRRAAIGQALDLARQGDTILVAGKGHETYQIIGTTKEPFDEREVVRALGAN